MLGQQRRRADKPTLKPRRLTRERPTVPDRTRCDSRERPTHPPADSLAYRSRRRGLPLKWAAAGLRNLRELYSHEVDSWVLYDNIEEPAVELGRSTDHD